MTSAARWRTAGVVATFVVAIGLAMSAALAQRAWQKELSDVGELLAYPPWPGERTVATVCAAFAWKELVRFGVDLLTKATLMAIAAGLAVALYRFSARARFRATGKDNIATIRDWLGRSRARFHGSAAALAALPLLALFATPFWRASHAWSVEYERIESDSRGLWYSSSWNLPISSAPGLLLATWILPAILLFIFARAGIRAACAPLEVEAAASRTDDLHFRALAVWPETRLTVGFMALLTVVAVGAAATLPLDVIVCDPRLPLALFGYSSMAIITALSFRASRVAVGLDGVFVRGTLRQRLIPYAGIECIEENERGELILRPTTRAPIRLQLHGSDSGRRGAILERIREGIARAQEIASGGVARLAEAASPALLEQAARGDGDYRAPGASRDELWQVLEAPSTSFEARAAAAKALAKTSDATDRERLRFAAEHFADARLRERLVRMVIESQDDDAPEEPARMSKRIARHA